MHVNIGDIASISSPDSAAIALSMGAEMTDVATDHISRIVQARINDDKMVSFNFRKITKFRSSTQKIFDAIRALDQGKDPKWPKGHIIYELYKVVKLSARYRKMWRDQVNNPPPTGSIGTLKTMLAATLTALGEELVGTENIDGDQYFYFMPSATLTNRIEQWNRGYDYSLIPDQDDLLYHFMGVLNNRVCLVKEMKLTQVRQAVQHRGSVAFLRENATDEEIKIALDRLTNHK